MLILIRWWTRPTGLPLALRLILCIGSPLPQLLAAEAARKPFAIPAAAAEVTLETFSDQAGGQVVFLIEDVRGVATNPVHGDFSIREALERLVDGTGLRVVQDEKTGAFVIKRDRNVRPPTETARNQNTAPPKTMKKSLPARLTAALAALTSSVLSAQTVPAASASSPEKDETVVLSPFEVTAAGDRGYYGANTMSGTRLNSKVEDLAASLTVVTKEQMADFAMLDINDVFLYEASTEGTGTYTEFSVDRNGSPVDNSLNPNSANRVRGVGPANISFGNFPTGVPIDPINIDALEISRGPNSTVFGLGNAGGTVNMVPASANLSRDRSQVALRGDSFDGYRASLDLNRVLKKGVLAVRGSGVFQHDGFVRKPSGTDTKRLNGMVRYQPFKYTSIIASYSYYRIDGNRPNTTMPRDAVTGWKKAGSPTWDPVTTTAKINGVRVPGTFSATTLPAYFSNASFRTNSTLFIDNTGAIGFWSPSRTTSATSPDTGNQNVVLVNTVPEPIRATQPLFSSDPSVNSKELYDWSSINLAAMNHITNFTGTTYVQIEQIFFDTPRHMLALQAGYFREDSNRRYRNLNGTATGGGSGPTGLLNVDVNERMIDGSPNPFFLRPFIGIYSVKAMQDGPSQNETSRVQLAYRLDLRREKSALRWLGMHQISGYGEYKNSRSRTSIYRDVILSNHAWYPAPTGQATAFTVPNIALNYYRYYVGDNVGQNADQAPHDFAAGTYPYRWGNGVTGQFVSEPAQLGPGYWYDSTSAYSASVLKTRGGVLQSHLLQERVVTTLGLRDDRRYNRSGALPLFNAGPDGVTLDYNSINQLTPDDWVHAGGKTKTAGIVVKPTRWLNVYANVSDSFQPQGVAVGLFLNPLPDPTGKGKDYGFALNFFDGKLVARVNKYDTTQIDSRNGSARTLAQRVRALDFDTQYSNVGLMVRAQGWITAAAAAQGRTLTPDQINQQVASLAQLDIAYLTRPETRAEQNDLVAETQDVTAKGTEVELNYNPTNFWTAKLNVMEQESIDSKIAPGITDWIAARMPVWQSIIDPEIGRPWFTERYGNNSSAQQFLVSQVTSQLAVAVANQGKSRPQIRQYRANLSTNYRLAGLSDNQLIKRFTLGGALRWEDKGGIGYYGVEQFPAIITALDPNRPVYDKAHLYADAFVAYRTRLFTNKVGVTMQLNVRNLQEGGRLQAISAFPDGTPNGYRIIDPRQFIFTVTFDL